MSTLQAPMNRNTLFTPAAFALMILVMTGCGTLTPQEDTTRYFALHATSQGSITKNANVAVGIGPATIPGYLDHKEIVTAGPANELILASFHVWAEPLDKAVTRVVAKNVSALLDSPAVVPFPDADVRQSYKVAIVIRRFEMNAAGRVLLDASYAIEGGPNSSRPGSNRSQSITVQVTRPEDYASVADAMSRAVGQLSNSIARDLLSLDRKHRTGEKVPNR